MRIIFIRHAEPDYSIDSLTEKGWREAKALAERVTKWDVTDFYVSPLGRAKDTASFSLERMGRTATEYDWLKEFYVPVLDPQTGKERIPWDFEPAFWTADKRFYDIDTWTEPDIMQTGNVAEEYKRVCAGLDDLLANYGYHRYERYYKVEKHTDDTIVIFCHLGVTCVMLSHLLGISPMQLWHGYFLAPSSVTVLSTEEVVKGNAYFRCQVMGDTNHLKAVGEPVSYYGYFTEPFQG
ncbi:MAG: histidine phosphatase family protein [Lachnospiraceae bacterium]|nr:histidine phosphatase family protein [Lachnospiraceae bacterium]